jgi:hypothetical protein
VQGLDGYLQLDLRGGLFGRWWIVGWIVGQFVSPVFDGSGEVLVRVCGQGEIAKREPMRAAKHVNERNGQELWIGFLAWLRGDLVLGRVLD